MENYYLKLLDKVKPKIIIEVVSYSFNNLLINEVAKKYKIPTIELQHGTIGRYHIAYNFKKQIYLPTFPDYIFLFGEYWKNNTRFPISNGKLKVTGFPYFEHKMNITKESKYHKLREHLREHLGTVLLC